MFKQDYKTFLQYRKEKIYEIVDELTRLNEEVLKEGIDPIDFLKEQVERVKDMNSRKLPNLKEFMVNLKLQVCEQESKSSIPKYEEPYDEENSLNMSPIEGDNDIGNSWDLVGGALNTSNKSFQYMDLIPEDYVFKQQGDINEPREPVEYDDEDFETFKMENGLFDFLKTNRDDIIALNREPFEEYKIPEFIKFSIPDEGDCIGNYGIYNLGLINIYCYRCFNMENPGSIFIFRVDNDRWCMAYVKSFSDRYDPIKYCGLGGHYLDEEFKNTSPDILGEIINVEDFYPENKNALKINPYFSEINKNYVPGSYEGWDNIFNVEQFYDYDDYNLSSLYKINDKTNTDLNHKQLIYDDLQNLHIFILRTMRLFNPNEVIIGYVNLINPNDIIIRIPNKDQTILNENYWCRCSYFPADEEGGEPPSLRVDYVCSNTTDLSESEAFFYKFINADDEADIYQNPQLARYYDLDTEKYIKIDSFIGQELDLMDFSDDNSSLLPDTDFLVSIPTSNAVNNISTGTDWGETENYESKYNGIIGIYKKINEEFIGVSREYHSVNGYFSEEDGGVHASKAILKHKESGLYFLGSIFIDLRRARKISFKPEFYMNHNLHSDVKPILPQNIHELNEMYGLNFNRGNEFYGGIMENMETLKPEIEITPIKIAPKEEVSSNFYNDIQMRENQNMEKTLIPNTIYLNFYHGDLVINATLKYLQHINEGISYYSYKSNEPEIEIVFTNKWKLTIINEDEQFVFYCPPSNNNTYAGLIPGEWYSEQENIKAIVNFTALPHLHIDVEYYNEYNSNERSLEQEENNFSNEIGEPGELNFIEDIVERADINSKIQKICPEPRLEKYWFYYQYLERKLDVFRESKGISNGFSLNDSMIKSNDYFPEYLERMKQSIGRVEFEEEQGLDYGGVRPSFFKLVVQDIVNNFFETKEMIDMKKQKLNTKILRSKKNRLNRTQRNTKKKSRARSVSPKRNRKIKPIMSKNNLEVDYGIYNLNNYELDEFCNIDDSSKKLYLKKYEHTLFNKESLGYELTYFYLGMSMASIMTCDSGEKKVVHLGMNLSQYLIYLMSDNPYLRSWEQILQCYQEDESLIYDNLEYMDIETVQDYLGENEFDFFIGDLEEKHLLAAVFLMVLKHYESNLKENFNFMMGFKYYIDNPMKIYELKDVIKGNGINKETMISILDKTEVQNYSGDTEMITWLKEIIEEGEETEEFNEFLKNLHIFWTGTEFEDFSKSYKIDITPDDNKDKVPTSSTCFNNLHLIVYDSKEIFKEKLEIAARNANEGFGFA
jgi:hypothetical protein